MEHDALDVAGILGVIAHADQALPVLQGTGSRTSGAVDRKPPVLLYDGRGPFPVLDHLEHDYKTGRGTIYNGKATVIQLAPPEGG